MKDYTQPAKQHGDTLQSLPTPDAPARRWGSERLKPRKDTLTNNYPPYLQADMVEAMVDSLIGGTYQAHGLDFESTLLEDFPDLFRPTPGRCLWTWADVIKLSQVDEEPHLVDLAPLYNLALRPSTEAVPPRLAAASLGMRWSDLHRALQFVAPNGNAGDYNDTHKTLSASVYPCPPYISPGAFPLMPRIRPPRNSRRTNLQHYALQQFDLHEEAGHPDNHSIMDALTRWPPVEVDMGPTLYKHWVQANHRLRQYAARAVSLAKANKQKPDRMHMHLSLPTTDLSDHIDATLNAFIHGPWDLSALDRDVEAIRKVKAALLWCLIQEIHGRSQTKYFKAATLVPLSVLSGTSLGSFIRWSMDRYRMTGHAFISEPAIEDCLLWVRDQAQASRTHTQAARISGLANELQDALAQMNLLREGVDATLQTNTHECLMGGMPAWGVGSIED